MRDYIADYIKDSMKKNIRDDIKSSNLTSNQLKNYIDLFLNKKDSHIENNKAVINKKEFEDLYEFEEVKYNNGTIKLIAKVKIDILR